MSNYPAEDREGRATATTAGRPTDETAADQHTEPSDVTGVDEIADADVVIIDEDFNGSADPGRHRSSAAGPVQTGAGADREAGEAGPALAGPAVNDEAGTGFGGAPVQEAPVGDAGARADQGASPEVLAGAPADGPANGQASGPAGAAANGLGPDDPGTPAVAQPAGGLAQLQDRWLAIQSDFVDDPRRSVTAAAELVTEAISMLTAEINDRDTSLRGTWEGADSDTEVLRTALREYRSFLDRLVAL
jgi:hypothetical protein